MYTPSVLKDEVVSMRGIVMSVGSPSDVICKVAGAVDDVWRTGVPCTQRQDRRNQKHFDKFNASPVL
jgi:hypothetical protein